jgi:hypothetical protein
MGRVYVYNGVYGGDGDGVVGCVSVKSVWGVVWCVVCVKVQCICSTVVLQIDR